MYIPRGKGLLSREVVAFERRESSSEAAAECLGKARVSLTMTIRYVEDNTIACTLPLEVETRYTTTTNNTLQSTAMFHEGDLQSGISTAIQQQKLVACFIRQGTISYL